MTRNRRKQNRIRLRKEKLLDGCTGKRRIEDRAEAERLAEELLRRNPDVRAVGVYLCGRCGTLHLTGKDNSDCWLRIERREGTGT